MDEINAAKAACNDSARPAHSTRNGVNKSEPTTSGSQYFARGSVGVIIDSENCSPPVFCDSIGASMPSSLAQFDPAIVVSANNTGLPTVNIDVWTYTGWFKSYVRELIDSVLDWDGMIFCVLRRDPFLADFENGGNQYCSSALVNALLALAIQTMGKELDINQSLDFSPQCSNTRSDRFFAEATSMLPEYGARPSNLADTQALGVLALYALSDRREDQAQELAERYVAAAMDLRLYELSTLRNGKDYEKACANAYCGAIALLRGVRIFILPRERSLSSKLSKTEFSIFLSPAGINSTVQYLKAWSTPLCKGFASVFNSPWRTRTRM